MQAVVEAREGDQEAEKPFAGPPAPAPQQGHAVEAAGAPPRQFQQAGAATGHHLVAEPQRACQQHCVLYHVASLVRSAFSFKRSPVPHILNTVN